MTYCLNCKNSSYCITCKAGYYMYKDNSDCQDSCTYDYGTYADPEIERCMVCIQVIQNCLECESYKICTKCNNAKLLRND